MKTPRHGMVLVVAGRMMAGGGSAQVANPADAVASADGTVPTVQVLERQRSWEYPPLTMNLAALVGIGDESPDGRVWLHCGWEL